jgi:hypothetical protein
MSEEAEACIILPPRDGRRLLLLLIGIGDPLGQRSWVAPDDGDAHTSIDMSPNFGVLVGPTVCTSRRFLALLGEPGGP